MSLFSKMADVCQFFFRLIFTSSKNSFEPVHNKNSMFCGLIISLITQRYHASRKSIVILCDTIQGQTTSKKMSLNEDFLASELETIFL